MLVDEADRGLRPMTRLLAFCFLSSCGGGVSVLCVCSH